MVDGEFDLGAAEFEVVFDSSPIGMAVMDGAGRFGRVNPSLCALLGRQADELVGRPVLEVTAPTDADETRALIAEMNGAGTAPGGAARQLRKRYLRPDGSLVQARVTVVRLPDRDGRRRTLAQIEDVTEAERQAWDLHRLATHDALTGLPGRRLLLQRLEELLADPARDVGAHVAVCFLDLDGFKLVNDALGHAAGDAVLVATADRLREAVGGDGTDGGDRVVGRLSGDEFLVLAAGVPGAAGAVELAEQLDRAVARPVVFGDDEVLVSASLGLALCSARETTVGELLANADAAMYEAKRLGRRRYEVFDQAMRERARTRSSTAALLHGSAATGRVVVHYQPIVALPGRDVVGVEALMRIRSGDALLLPDAFLGVAADTGALLALERELMAQASEQVQRWRGATGRELQLSVNVTAAHVGRELLSSVARALERSGLPARCLTVELTEQVLLDAGPQTEGTLRALAEQGVAVVVDDFGVGWGSLTYLRAFPVSGIKIDRSFVAGLDEAAGPLLPAQDPGRLVQRTRRRAPTVTPSDPHVLVAALLDLGRRLDLQVTAEGVETETQLAGLVQQDATHGQGLLFGGAVAGDRFGERWCSADPG